MLKKTSDAYTTLLILLGFAALAYLPFVYNDVSGEPDGFRIARGIIASIRDGNFFTNPLLYNAKMTYGYYTLLYLFTPLFRLNESLVIPVMNYIGATTAILMVIPLFFIVRAYWGTTAAVVANLLLMFVPSWWGLSLYGHPMMQVMFFGFIGVALIVYRAAQERAQASRWQLTAVDALIVITFFLSMTFRFDALSMFPLITATLLLEKYSLQKIIFRSALYGLLPPLLFFATLAMIIDTTMSNVAALVVDRFVTASGNRISPGHLLQGTIIWVLALHPLYLLVFAIAMIYLTYRRNYLALFFILPPVLINLAWIINPFPARHFVYMSPLVAIGSAIGLTELLPRIKFLPQRTPLLVASLVAILFVMVSFISIEAIYLGVRAIYPWRNEPQVFHKRVPIRSVFVNRYYLEQYFQESTYLAKDLQQLTPMGSPVVVVTDISPMVVQLQLLSGEVVVEKKTIILGKKSWNVFQVNNRRNDFILWRRNDLAEFLEKKNPYSNHYFILDPYNSYIATFDNSIFQAKFGEQVISLDRSKAHC